MRRVISLFLPTWPTDRWRRSNQPHRLSAPPPAEEEAPLVLSARVGSRVLVHAAGASALALGVIPGMAVSQAQAMLPGLHVEVATPDQDAAALRGLAAWCLRFSPLVSSCAPDGVWIDSFGCAHLWGGEVAMLRHVVAQLRQAGISARAAMADTPGCAHAVARYGKAAVTVVPPGAVAEAMARLPVAALRLAPEVADALRLLGFDTVGQLIAAPRAPLTRRFGATALRRLDQALGRAAEPLEPVAPPELCRVRQGFPEPIATPDDLARVTSLLAGMLCAKMLRRQLGATRLDLVFQRVDGVAQWVRVGLGAPSRDVAHLTRLLLAQIETVDPGFGVDQVVLTASGAERLEGRQSVSDLACDSGAVDLTPLVDTLVNRLGGDRVFRQGSVESELPERSVTKKNPVGFGGSGGDIGALRRPPRGSPPPILPSWPRPTRLFCPPRRVEAMALLPDHAPVQFTWRRKPHRIRRADGPERVFGEWWVAEDEVFAVRDYFQVEDEDGQRFWLFRNGDGQHAATGDLSWFLHGVFG
jgi:protein ImuB